MCSEVMTRSTGRIIMIASRLNLGVLKLGRAKTGAAATSAKSTIPAARADA